MMAAIKYWKTMNIGQTANIFNNNKEQNLFNMLMYTLYQIWEIYDYNEQSKDHLQIWKLK